jgi:hypothetical protein
MLFHHRAHRGTRRGEGDFNLGKFGFGEGLIPNQTSPFLLGVLGDLGGEPFPRFSPRGGLSAAHLRFHSIAKHLVRRLDLQHLLVCNFL